MYAVLHVLTFCFNQFVCTNMYSFVYEIIHRALARVSSKHTRTCPHACACRGLMRIPATLTVESIMATMESIMAKRIISTIPSNAFMAREPGQLLSANTHHAPTLAGALSGVIQINVSLGHSVSQERLGFRLNASLFELAQNTPIQ